MRKEKTTTTHMSRPIAKRLDLIESEFIDDRLRGHYFFPIDWFVTGVTGTENSYNIFVRKTTAFGEKLWHDSLVMHVYLPFQFEGRLVILK